MVIIKPFQGYRYNLDKVEDFGRVITPPYDIISPAAAENYRARSPYNYVHIILPQAEGDLSQYEVAGNLLRDWIGNNIFIQDPARAIYAYAQTFCSFGTSGEEKERLSFVALLDIAPGNDVFAHEHTLQKPFEDRLRLMEATRAYLGLPFLLYDDSERVIDGLLQAQIAGRPADVEFTDEENVKHRLWAITDEDTINRVVQEMGANTCVIADGHHRFKVARKFYEECFENGQDPESAQFPMMCFVNSCQEALVIWPTNRVVFNIEVPEDLLQKLGEQFDVTEENDITAALAKLRATPVVVDAARNIKNHVFVLFDSVSNKAYFLQLRDPSVLQELQPEHSETYRKIDINVLHTLVFEGILGISPEDQLEGTKIEYFKGDDATLAALQETDAKYQLGFFLNAPLIQE
ncbi:MAG TPA: DUF1015 domain-containing protein, partial [Candidatus Lokiarchaeia archaeon]|nr:DUF1015 domain-containing protein [Candidatus Lokiarchaeia archaeon]